MTRSDKVLLTLLPLTAGFILWASNANVQQRRAATTRFMALWSGSPRFYPSVRACRMTVAQVRQELDQGADINVHDADGDTALMVAARADNLPVLRLLLERGADVHARCIAPHPPRRFSLFDLLPPLRFWSTETLPSPTDSLATALNDTDAEADPAVVRLLVEHGADANAADKAGYTPLMDAVQCEYIPRFNPDRNRRDLFREEMSPPQSAQSAQLLLDHGAIVDAREHSGQTALFMMPAQALIPILLAHGANPNLTDNRGMTPLMSAARSNYSHFVVFLLAHGANREAKDAAGMTAPMYAAGINSEPTFKVLLKLGTNIHQVSHDGETVLIAAVNGDSAAAARLLLQRGLAVNAQDSAGDTPLMCAVTTWHSQSHTPLVKVLLSYRASVNVRNKKGQTALSLAKATGDTDVISLLKSAGAK